MPDSQQPVRASSPAFQSHPRQAERYALGKSLREKCPRASHVAWQPAADRPDPPLLLEQSSQGRIPELLPVRYGRMLKSPFTFYRGAALNMAADLAVTPASGLRVQACGEPLAKELTAQETAATLQRILDAVQKDERNRWVEIGCAVVLSLAMMASPWCAYQAILWSGVQTFRLAAESKASRVGTIGGW